MFLNEEKRALKDCSNKQIAAIVRSSCVQVYSGREWIYNRSGLLSQFEVYRTPPKQMTINWSHIGDGWNHLRVDNDEEFSFYTQPPDLKCSFWASSGEMAEGVDIRLLASFERGDLPWHEAICDRPGFETNN